MRYWVVGEFQESNVAVEAVRLLRGHGWRELDAYSPYPVKAMSDALELRPSWLRPLALGGAISGGAVAYVIQWWTSAIDQPLNVGDRPLHSAPAFLPITFELSVLFASLAIVGGLLFTLKLPRPHHPLMELDAFRRASTGSFWVSLTVETTLRVERAEQALREVRAAQVWVVEDAS